MTLVSVASPKRANEVTLRYLSRLGLDAEPPSVEALFRIHRAQVERVPYETLWIQLGELHGIDPAASFTRLATSRRGGYCYHLNGALSVLLAELGYRVSRHVGGVHGPTGPSPDEMTNHLVLTVAGLPHETNPEGTWYVDAGLGDALYEPLPLKAGSYKQGPFLLGLEATPGQVGEWHLTHGPSGSFTGMSWRSAEVGIEAFEARHAWLSTSAESGFVRYLTVQRRDADGADVLRGLVLKRIDVSGTTEQVLTSETDLFQVLTDTFGLDVGLPSAVRRGLWSRLDASHRTWEAAGRP